MAPFANIFELISPGVPHMCVSQLGEHCSDSGLAPIPRQALSKQMLVYCQLDSWEQASVKFESKYKTFHSVKCTGKCRLRNDGHIVQGE